MSDQESLAVDLAETRVQPGRSTHGGLSGQRFRLPRSGLVMLLVTALDSGKGCGSYTSNLRDSGAPYTPHT